MFASYLGSNTLGSAIALDQAGDIYVAGALNTTAYLAQNDTGSAIPLKGEFEAFPAYSNYGTTLANALLIYDISALATRRKESGIPRCGIARSTYYVD